MTRRVPLQRRRWLQQPEISATLMVQDLDWTPCWFTPFLRSPNVSWREPPDAGQSSPNRKYQVWFFRFCVVAEEDWNVHTEPGTDKIAEFFDYAIEYQFARVPQTSITSVVCFFEFVCFLCVATSTSHSVTLLVYFGLCAHWAKRKVDNAIARRCARAFLSNYTGTHFWQRSPKWESSPLNNSRVVLNWLHTCAMVRQTNSDLRYSRDVTTDLIYYDRECESKG